MSDPTTIEQAAAETPPAPAAPTGGGVSVRRGADRRRASAVRRPAGSKTTTVSKVLRPGVAASLVADERLPWRERLRRWVLSFDALSVGVSLLFHTVVLLLLSLVITKGVPGTGAISTLLSESEEGDSQFEELAEATLENEQPQLAEESPQLAALPLEAEELRDPTLPGDLTRSLEGLAGDESGGGEGDGEGGGFGPPKGGNAVTRGSFTAWTVPPDPAPFQNYAIFIRIDLPRNVQRLERNDLSGLVVGTDGYRQLLPGPGPRYLRTRNRSALLKVMVPAARQPKVRDTIQIRSRVLKEQQTLEIEF